MSLAIRAQSLIRLEGTVHRFSHWTTGGALVLRDVQNGNTIQLDEDSFLELFSGNQVELNVPPPDKVEPWQIDLLRADFISLPDHLRAEALRRQAYLDEILKANPVGPQKTVFPRTIDAVALRIGDKKRPKWQTAANWLRKYQAASYDVRALVPGHARKGRPQIQVSDDEMKILIGCAQAWLDGSNSSKQSFVDQVETAYRDAKGRIPGAGSWNMPSRSTLYRFLAEIDPYEVLCRRHGRRAADEHFKMVDRKQPPRHRLERVEIDHTPLDIYVVDPKTRLMLGRPWITAAIDVYTRMIVGFYIGFEPPGTYSVMRCLHSMILPKTYVPKEWPELPLTWNPYGIPFCVLVDNALEFRADSFKHVAQVLGMTIEQAPVRHPEFKGTIERFFGTLKTGVITQLPGRPVKPSDKHGTDPASTACVTLPELRKLVHYWLIAEYCNTPHKGIMDVPQRRWDEENKMHPSRLPNNLADLEALLGMLGKGKLTREGVRLHHLQYKSDLLRPLLQAAGGSLDVYFKYDPGDLGKIYVIHPETRRPITVPVQAQDAEYATGLSMYLHKAIVKFLHQRNKVWTDREARKVAVDEFRRDAQRMLQSRRVRGRAKLARLVGGGVSQPQTDIASLIVQEQTNSGSFDDAFEDIGDVAAPATSRGEAPHDDAGSPSWPSAASADLDAAFAAAAQATTETARHADKGAQDVPRPHPKRTRAAGRKAPLVHDLGDDEIEPLPVFDLSRGKRL